MTILVVDDEEDLGEEPFEVLRPSELGLEAHELNRILTLFEPVLLPNAFRGALMRHLLRTRGDTIVFLDPDTQVFASLDGVSRLAAEHGVVLSPHLLDAPDHHEGFGGDRAYLLAGAFNAGLLGVGPGGGEFLDWWCPRLQRWPYLAPADGYYGVQRWLDLVPALFEHHVLRDPGCNVMTLNAHERSLSSRGGQWYAREDRLRLFHFGGGFDPRQPYLIAPGYAPTEVLLSEHPALADLHRDYADALLSSGWERRAALPTSLELEPGVRLDATMRAIYRAALLASEQTGASEPPNPYRPGSAFMDWLGSPSDMRRKACTVSRYLQTRWRDGELASRFPDLLGEDAARYLEWARGPEGVAAGIPASLSEPAAPAMSPLEAPTSGVNLVTPDLGLGDFVGERVADQLRLSGGHIAKIVYPGPGPGRTEVSAGLARAATGDVTVICLPPAWVPAFDYDVGVLFRPGRLLIVVVIDSIHSPEDLAKAAEFAHEIWCWDASNAARIREACDVPTAVLPFPADAPDLALNGGELRCWADLGEPGHADAVLSGVANYLRGAGNASDRLHVCLSRWQAEPLAYETLWGLASSDERLAVHGVTDWREALARADTILSLGSGIGPVEAEALAGGIRVVSAAGTDLIAAGIAASFGAATAERLARLRARRSAP